METDTPTPLDEFLKTLFIEVIVVSFYFIISGALGIISSDIHQYSSEDRNRISLCNVLRMFYFNQTMDKVLVLRFSQWCN
jgi:hypothetical protein